MTCHSTSAHLTIVAVVATQRRTAGHGPAHRPLSSLLAERPYSLVEPAPLDDGKLVRPLETLSKSGILKCLSSKRLLMPSVSHRPSDHRQCAMFGWERTSVFISRYRESRSSPPTGINSPPPATTATELQRERPDSSTNCDQASRAGRRDERCAS